MKKSNTCPKCNSKNIYKVHDDEIKGYVGWFIPLAKHIPTQSTKAYLTVYICEQCGFIEPYLEGDELNKARTHLGSKENI